MLKLDQVHHLLVNLKDAIPYIKTNTSLNLNTATLNWIVKSNGSERLHTFK